VKPLVIHLKHQRQSEAEAFRVVSVTTLRGEGMNKFSCFGFSQTVTFPPSGRGRTSGSKEDKGLGRGLCCEQRKVAKQHAM
jgi:hypothetical protein